MKKFEEMIIQEIKELSGMDAKPFFEKGIVQVTEARKWIVKQRYNELSKTTMRLSDIKADLSERYAISVSAIEKMIYQQKSEENDTK
ncbi:MAG: hypothetical protein FD155_3435 [Bacteroidetes bacterium]|nr:MAG: hypothetical protein FD155_3435 [Bacteroidota bacterium]